MKKTRFLYKMLLLIIGSGIFVSCSTYENRGDDSVTKLLSISQFDSENNFTQYTTFRVCDSMLVLDGKDTNRVLNSTVNWIKDQLKSEMLEAGYTQAPEGEQPDLYVLLSGVKNAYVTYAYGFYNPYYWGYYDPFYWGDPYSYFGWGYYYPAYPMITSAYTAGAAIMEMVDIKNADLEKKQMKIVWVGLVRGLMDFKFTEPEVKEAVSDCFTQTSVVPFNK